MTELAHDTKNFKVMEFACHCGRFDCPHIWVDQKLLYALQKLRDLIGVPIHVNSGCRCPSWNKKQNGKQNSQHLFGKAADIWADGLTPVELRRFAEEIPEFAKGGIGIYDWGIHVDVRGYRARWDYRSKK